MGKFFKEAGISLGLKLLYRGTNITANGVKHKSFIKVKDGLTHVGAGLYEGGASALRFVPGGPNTLGRLKEVSEIAKKYVV